MPPGPLLPAPGRALTPTLPPVWEEAGAGAGWRVRALPRPWEKGAFVEPGPFPTHPPLTPTVGTFLGRGLASSARSGPWGGGQRLGWGLSMGLCASSQEASVAELTALTLQPTGPRPPGPRQPCPAQPCGPARPHGHPPLRAPRPHLLSRGCHPHSLGACSVSHRGWGGPGAELGCAPRGPERQTEGAGGRAQLCRPPAGHLSLPCSPFCLRGSAAAVPPAWNPLLPATPRPSLSASEHAPGHERLPEILVVPREKTPTGAAARGNLFGPAVTRAQPPAGPRNPRGRLGFPGPTQGEG